MNSALQWIDAQKQQMLDLLERWARINSGTHNLAGIEKFSAAVEGEFAGLGGEVKHHDLLPIESIDSSGNIVRTPAARAISLTKRPQARVKILLCIHLDTVYPPTHAFQQVTRVDENTLRGPGVADAKGGLVVMLHALRALEQSDLAKNLGWEIILNPDEEIGSPASGNLLTEAAKRNHFGLVFEPALPDGSLVGARKGSGNFTIVIHGKAAHAGRDFHLGRSAIVALAQFIIALQSTHADFPQVTVNCGKIEGGSALNIVPDLAIGRFNIRVTNSQEQQAIERRLRNLVSEFNLRDGIRVEPHGQFNSPPKPLDEKSSKLLELAQSCGREIGLNLQIRPTGGACDGNRLAAAGLAVIDTLGPVGDHLHSDREFIHLDTLAQRAKLTTLLLMKLATGSVG
jgi:glutamate carboxypeptidase